MIQRMKKNSFSKGDIKNLYKNTFPNEYFPFDKFEVYFERDNLEEKIVNDLIKSRRRNEWGKIFFISSSPRNGNTSFLNYLIINLIQHSEIIYDKILILDGEEKFTFLKALYPWIFSKNSLITFFRNILLWWRYKLNLWKRFLVFMLWIGMFYILIKFQGIWIGTILGIILPIVISKILTELGLNIPSDVESYLDSQKGEWLLNKLYNRIANKLKSDFYYGVYIFIDNFERMDGEEVDKIIKLIKKTSNSDLYNIRSWIILLSYFDEKEKKTKIYNYLTKGVGK